MSIITNIAYAYTLLAHWTRLMLDYVNFLALVSRGFNWDTICRWHSFSPLGLSSNPTVRFSNRLEIITQCDARRLRTLLDGFLFHVELRCGVYVALDY